MKTDRVDLALLLAGLAILPGCAVGDDVADASKGGDERNGAYDAPTDWWKPHPESGAGYTYAQVSGVVADNPNRIIVGVRGDWTSEGEERPNSSNYILVVDANGDIIENWTQWDTTLAFPHQLYISPYDPERHIWIVERGGTMKTIHEQILKFTNDGKQLVMRLRDPNPIERQGGPVARDNPNPGPLDFGQASTMAFLPNGDFLVGDGYQNGRIIRYNEQGEFISEFGSVGSGPGQFDLIHGIAVDRDRRIYTADRRNNRIQIFTEDGVFIEEWPNILDPVGVYVDESDGVWVISATLNRILKYNRDGELQTYFGTFGGTRGGFPGGMARPHQLSVDQDGNLYVTGYDGPWLNKYTPKPGADPARLVDQPIVLN
tara:strand:+ start:4661 stop:5782 length:1122 start_codon:yes stop_codon:yes gene_type:complete